MIIFGINQYDLRLAPIGAFRAMAFTISITASGTLVPSRRRILYISTLPVSAVVVAHCGFIAKATGSSSTSLSLHPVKNCLIVLDFIFRSLPRTMLDGWEELNLNEIGGDDVRLGSRLTLMAHQYTDQWRRCCRQPCSSDDIVTKSRC